MAARPKGNPLSGVGRSSPCCGLPGFWLTVGLARVSLRGIDLMTSQGQTIVTFLGVTSLVIPALVLIISPIALMIAISHTLNKLATDSEIIVMNAAGFSPFRLFRPFLYATCVVALLVAFIASYLSPDGLRPLKQWDAEITPAVLPTIPPPAPSA